MNRIEVLGDLRPYDAGLLAGARTIVTGGGSGLGRGISHGLAACGAHVVVSGRRVERIQDVADEIVAAGGSAEAIACNVRDQDSVQELIDQAGTVDILVNNAGATFTAPALDLTANGFRAVVETDAFGTFFACQAFARRLVDAGRPGCILNITSTSPFTGNPGRVHGGVGKAGVESLTKSLAVEWGPLGIRVNSLAPGYTPTAGVNTATGLGADAAAHAERLASGVPLRRLGMVADIVWPAVFLVSPAAAFVNGASLVVDGGKWLSSGRSSGVGSDGRVSAPAPN